MRGALGVLAVVGLLVLSAAPAGAAVIHKRLFQLSEVPAVGPNKESIAVPGPLLRNLESMSVDAGHLWVAEGKYGGLSRVDEFDAATGGFLAQPVHVEAPKEAERRLPTGYGEGYGEGIAVGHGPGEAAVYVGGEQHGVSVVSVFNEAGALKGTWNGAATPAGSFGVILEPENGHAGEAHSGTVTDVAVDNSTNPLDPGKGDVFVAVRTQGLSLVGGHVIYEPGVIDVFHPEADGEERYVGQITGASVGESFHPSKVAVNEANGDLLVLDRSSTTVEVFEPTGPGAYVFVRKLAGPPPSGSFHEIFTLAVDSGNGDVYVSEFPPENAPYRLDQFSAAGAYLGQVEDIPDAYAIAVDSETHDLYVREEVYGPDITIPDVTTAAPSSVGPESAQLNGTVNADGVGKASCQFDYGTTPALGKFAPCPKEIEGESPVPVQVTVELERDMTYYYRLQASDTNGTNPGEAWQTESFKTPGAVIGNESVADVSADSATFAATIDPNKQATSYYFQYGPSTEYGQTSPAPPGEAIGSGTAGVEVPVMHVRGLLPGTVYHYRAVAVSEAKPGEVETVFGEDRTFTTQAAGGSFSLLDGRQWELVSPPDKRGALIEPGGGNGSLGASQASAAGDAIAYESSSPTESEPGGYAHIETVLSTRAADGEWSTQDISTPHNQAAGSLGSVGLEYRLFSPDLSLAAVMPASSEFTPLSPEASESTTYLRSDFPAGDPQAHCESSCYRPLVTGKPGYANVPSGIVFGEEPTGICERQVCGPQFEGASPDLSHVILSSPAQLTETPAPAGAPGLYEWSAGRLQLVGVLPRGEAGPAILAGSYVVPTGPHEPTGVRNAVSDNGERVILEGGAHGGEGVYLRETGAGEAGGETIRLDVPQGGPGRSEEASYMTASSDGSRVFFLDPGRLTANASVSGKDLYEYDLNAPAGSHLSDLSADANAGEAAEVLRVLGASEDGSYVYFLASGALAEGAKPGALNLYVRHAGTTRLIATLAATDYAAFYEKRMFARVSPDGGWLAFMSSGDLTGYDTRDAVSGVPDAEVYLYDAATARLVCASCNPTGARPAGTDLSSGNRGALFLEGWVAGNIFAWSPIDASGEIVGTYYQSRYLSDSGRLFFDSSDALVPQDVNGVMDVYEYEPVGVGGCTSSEALFAARSDGCVGLVSSGTSPSESAFLDASETGRDVFFLTQSRLVSQDYDTAYDVYDAQECTNAAPCASSPVAPPACTTEASCKAAPAPQPALYGAPASATFSGAGNLAPTPAPVGKSKSKPRPKSNSKPRCAKHGAKRRCTRAKKASRKARRGARARGAAVARRGGGR